LQLSPEQHQKLESLLLARTRAPRKFGEYDYYGVMYQMSKLPEQDLKPIFNEEQWQKIGLQFAQAQRLENVLRRGGFLPEEDVAEAGKTRRDDAILGPERPRG
jgi:hypothetical protein